MNRKIQLLLLLVAAVASVFGMAACGSGNNNQVQITVTITSPATSVAVNQTLQFTAVVNNTSNTAVTWQVNGTMGGNIATTGSISATGLFQAPAQVPSPATVNITAVSQADSAVTSNTIVVTITAANNSGVVVSPATPVLPAGGQQIFSATENGNAITPTFTVTSSSASCVIAACLGSFSGSDIYSSIVAAARGSGDDYSDCARQNDRYHRGNDSIFGRVAQRSVRFQFFR